MTNLMVLFLSYKYVFYLKLEYYRYFHRFACIENNASPSLSLGTKRIFTRPSHLIGKMAKTPPPAHSKPQ